MLSPASSFPFNWSRACLISLIHSELSDNVKISILLLISSNIEWISLLSIYSLTSSNQFLFKVFASNSILLFRDNNKLSLPRDGIEDLFCWGKTLSISALRLLISCFKRSKAFKKSKFSEPTIISSPLFVSSSLWNASSSKSDSALISWLSSSSISMSKSWISASSFKSVSVNSRSFLITVIVSILSLILFKTEIISEFSPDNWEIILVKLLKSSLISAMILSFLDSSKTFSISLFSKSSSVSIESGSSGFSTNCFALVLNNFFKSLIALIISLLLIATASIDLISSCLAWIFSFMFVLISFANSLIYSFCSFLNSSIWATKSLYSCICSAFGVICLDGIFSKSAFRLSILIITESISPSIKSFKLFSVCAKSWDILW